MYAKIKNNTAIKYPYNVLDLQQDGIIALLNPGVSFEQLFAQTGAFADGHEIVEVLQLDSPDNVDITTHDIRAWAVPRLIDNKWTMGWSITDIPVLSPEELQNVLPSTN